MLAFLIAAVAPLLIHLWSRRRYQETPWAAMAFLLAAVQRSTRRIRLEQWFLLCLRTLLIVVVVAAVAEPYFEGSGSQPSASKPLHYLLVIDNSYSMAYRPTDKTLFEQAKATALQILKQAKKGDLFTLLSLADPQSEIDTTADQELLIRKLQQLPLVHSAADLSATMRAANQAIKTVARDKPGVAGHQIYFFSDLQRTTWAPHLSAGSNEELWRQAQDLAHQASLVLIDLGNPTAENLAVTDLKTPALILAGQETNVEVHLRNFGRQGRANQNVDFLINGRRIAREVVNVPPAGDVGVKFKHRFSTPGEQVVEVSAAGDLLEIDNHRYVATTVREKLRVLCIDGRPYGKPFQGAADYVAAALAPSAAASEDTSFQVEVAGESALLERNLGEYDCVILCNIAQFAADEVRLFDTYLRHGGSLIFFPGDETLPESYNRDLSVSGHKEGEREFLLPAQLGSLVEEPQTRLNAFEFRHPVLAVFRGGGESGLLTTPVFKYFKLIPEENSSANTILALLNGDPLLMERAVRRGRVLLWATAAEPTWSGLPLWPSFVPLLQETVLYCAAGEGRKRNVAVGEPLELLLPAAAAEVQLTLRLPDSSERMLQPRLAGGQAVLSFSDTFISGIYQFRLPPPMEQNLSYAVNLDTRESDLAKVEEKELREKLWPGVDFRYAAGQSDLLSPSKPAVSRGREWSCPLLSLALLLLFIETFTAWKLGRHGKE